LSRKTESWPIRVPPGKLSRTTGSTRTTVWEPLTQRTSHKVPNVNNLMHRRTRRGVKEGGRPLASKISGQTLFFRASASCSTILHGEKIFNTAYIHLGFVRVIWASVLCNLDQSREWL